MSAPITDLVDEAERLLASDRLTKPTRAALRTRMDRRYGAPRLFSIEQMRTLTAVAARLIPAPDFADRIDLPNALDASLVDGNGDGWRYADTPPDRGLHLLGLDAMEAAAQEKFRLSFEALEPQQQDDLLTQASKGELGGEIAPSVARWFEEVLSALVELHYSHPLAQVAIGYDGMADARGWQNIGLADVSKEDQRVR